MLIRKSSLQTSYINSTLMCTKLQSCNKTDDWNLVQFAVNANTDIGSSWSSITFCIAVKGSREVVCNFLSLFISLLWFGLYKTRWELQLQCTILSDKMTQKERGRQSQGMCLTLVWIKSFTDKIKSLLITVLQFRKLPCSLLALYFEILRSSFSGIYSFKRTEVYM